MLKDEAFIPERLRTQIPTRQALLAHDIRVNASRWRRKIAELNLPEPGPLLQTRDWTRISRGDVLMAGDAEINTTNATQLFYYSLAWGLGPKGRNLGQRLDSFGRDAEFAPQLLAKAWTAVREDRPPAECYEVLLTPKGRARIHFFGAAFATKFLYFAHGTSTPPRNLILDQVVATNLRPDVWANPPTHSWWSDTYHRYCGLLHRWAHQASADGAESIEPDQLEMAIFRS